MKIKLSSIRQSAARSTRSRCDKIGSNDIKKSLWIIHVNPVARVWKNMNRNFPLGQIYSLIGKPLEPLYYIGIPPVTPLCTNNCYLHPFWWAFKQRPVGCFPRLFYIHQFMTKSLGKTIQNLISGRSGYQRVAIRWNICEVSHFKLAFTGKYLLPVRIEHLNGTFKIERPRLLLSRAFKIAANPFWQGPWKP